MSSMKKVLIDLWKNRYIYENEEKRSFGVRKMGEP